MENPEIVDTKLAEAESEWPEYKSNTMLTAVRSYTVKTDHDLTEKTFATSGAASLKAFATEGAAWLKAYLHQDFEELQRFSAALHLKNRHPFRKRKNGQTMGTSLYQLDPN